MFDKIVSLYRKLGNPSIQEGIFEYEGEVDDGTLAILDELKNLHSCFGFFQTKKVTGNTVDLEFKIPSGDQAFFFKDIDDLVSSFQGVGKGELPKNFYLQKEDWSPFDEAANEKFSRLQNICSLIIWLEKLAVGVDKESNPYFNGLFFAIPSSKDNTPKSFVVKTKVSPESLGFDLKHLALVGALVDPKHDGKLHIEERKMIFQLSIADVLDKANGSEEKFNFLVRNWDDLISIYWKNLQAYVYGFSFEKIRLKVAESEVEYSSKLSNVLGSIAGKLLALPVSLVALPLLVKANTVFDFVVVAFGLFLVTLILLCVIINHWLQFLSLKESFDVIFEQFRKKVDAYPKSLQIVMNKSFRQVDNQGKALKITFLIFAAVSFVPVLGVIYIYDDKYGLFDYLVFLIEGWDKLRIFMTDFYKSAYNSLML